MMSALDDYLQLGETVILGSHLFEAQQIKEFARKFDPQSFHIDEKAAENSLFGRLCASGWHTVSTWMKYNMLHRQKTAGRPWNGEGAEPEFGPAGGFENLKWLKPVYAGETVTFTRHTLSYRALSSRPGWQMVKIECGAFDSTGDKVLEFESAVLLKAE